MSNRRAQWAPPEAPPARFRAWGSVPEEARALLAAGPARLHYECVAATFRAADRFLKVQPLGTYPSLAHEAERLLWLNRYLHVPAVIDVGRNTEAEWLCTSALPGTDATTLVDDPEFAVPVFARGLRAFHDALPVEACPFSFRHHEALSHIRRRLADINPRGWHLDHAHLTVGEAFSRLYESPPREDDLVVCHGDYCFPNVLVEGSSVTGYLDVGELGISSRWRDLAVATWTCTWNLGPGHEGLFLEAYGAPLDMRRQQWFRLLYEMVS